MGFLNSENSDGAQRIKKKLRPPLFKVKQQILMHCLLFHGNLVSRKSSYYITFDNCGKLDCLTTQLLGANSGGIFCRLRIVGYFGTLAEPREPASSRGWTMAGSCSR